MARGWTQTQLADRLQVRPANVSRWKSGTYHSLTFARLRQLADVLATSTDYLLGRREDPGPVPDQPCLGGGAGFAGNPCLPATTTLLQKDGD